ncbi:MAG: ATP-binding protein, partial [Catalinimonas sp.]
LFAGLFGVFLLRYTTPWRWHPPGRPRWWAAGVLVAAYALLWGYWGVLRTLYFNARTSLDITRGLQFDALQGVQLSIVVGLSLLYFGGTHLLAGWFPRWVGGRRRAAAVYAAVTFGFLCVAFVPGGLPPVVVLLGAGYYALVYGWRLPRYVRRFSYQSYVYFFTCAVVCAGVGASVLYEYTQREQRLRKQQLATQLMVDNDVWAEYLLHEASTRIAADNFIREGLLNVFASEELIEEKVRRHYLNTYFDKYDVQVAVFNGRGDILSDIGEDISYERMRRIYDKPANRTEYGDIFLNSNFERGQAKRYLSFIELRARNLLVGHVVIELRSKRIIPNTVYPELLMDQRFARSPLPRDYSYAVFNRGGLEYSAGDFNYRKAFGTRHLARPELFAAGVEAGGVHHLAARGAEGKVVVISSPVYPLGNVFSNFSFLFLVLAFCTLVVLVLYALLRRYVAQEPVAMRLTFANKIQIYLNIAFFLPLLTVSVIILSIISQGYRRDLQASYVRQADVVSTNVTADMERFLVGTIGEESLLAPLLDVSRNTETDLNLFGTDGRLVVATQSMIYDKGLIARFAPPEAVAAIVEQNEDHVVLAEDVGSFHYSAVYKALRSFETGRLVGILSIPFFESKAELDRQIVDVVTMIMNVFTAIFLLFLLLSYFASRLLTEPLKLITQKLKRTTLDRNEPLEWDTNDEIGLLVTEYNRMIQKLEASRAALSRSEKESAWREMARQVAHEIKNPLTPMKLTLQHLERALKNGNGNARALSERAVNTLLTQVDTLNDIATSFSAFAKMPVPKTERFELVGLVRRTVQLYESDAATELRLELPAGERWVVGDAQLMSRTLTNLLLNAIQSVPAERTPGVSVRVTSRRDRVTIQVSDNGTGIPEAIQDKVFVPNFSTKYAGSGLGLAVAKRGVEHAGGRIWFETEDDRGTRFYIELPLERA